MSKLEQVSRHALFLAADDTSCIPENMHLFCVYSNRYHTSVRQKPNNAASVVHPYTSNAWSRASVKSYERGDVEGDMAGQGGPPWALGGRRA